MAEGVNREREFECVYPHYAITPSRHLTPPHAPPTPPPYPRVQEEARRLKDGSMKKVAFTVMHARGGPREGMTLEEVVEAAKGDGVQAEIDDKQRKKLKHVGSVTSSPMSIPNPFQFPYQTSIPNPIPNPFHE